MERIRSLDDGKDAEPLESKGTISKEGMVASQNESIDAELGLVVRSVRSRGGLPPGNELD
jgi:hypothetical protein